MDQILGNKPHALGCSRGGFSTKVHLTCGNEGHPLVFELTDGKVHEGQAVVTLLEYVDSYVVDLKEAPRRMAKKDCW